MELPIMFNDAMQLVHFTPGIQVSGINSLLNYNSIPELSSFSANGGVGGNSFTLGAQASNFGSMFIILKNFSERQSPDLKSDAIIAKL